MPRGKPKPHPTLADALKVTGDPALADSRMKCSAHSKAGNKCKQWALPGCAVCHYHGGKAPQVLAAARRRLAATDALIRYEVTQDWVIQRLALLADASLADFGTIGSDGMYQVDLSQITHQQARAIQEITVDQAGGGAGDGER